MNFLRIGDILRLSFIILWLAAPAQAWFFGKDHPSQSEIESYIRNELPQVLSIEDVDVGSQDMRQELIEFSESRVRVAISTTEPLYVYLEPLADNTPLIELRTPAGTTIEAFALVQARATGEGWDGRVLWDDSGAFSKLGRQLEQMPQNALLKGSDGHAAHLAILEEQRAAAAQELLQLQRDVSGTFEGRAVCGRQQHEVASLKLDGVSGTGKLLTRVVDIVEQPWTEIDLQMTRFRDSESFDVRGSDWAFTVARKNGEPVFDHRSCTLTLYPEGQVPQKVSDARAQQAAILDLLTVGKVEAEALFGAERRPHIEAEILEVGERGFRMKVFHTSRLNGRFGGPNFASRSTSILTVTFADPPAFWRFGGQIDGRGDLILNPRCPVEITVTESGRLRLQEYEGYLCALQVDLIP